MKTLIKSSLVALAASVAFGVSASAQIKTVEQALSEFNALEVSGMVASSSFAVDIQPANEYFITLTVDDAVLDNVIMEVKRKTLCLGINEKAISKEVKKMYKTKGSVPCTLKATIYVPYLNEISASDNTSIVVLGETNVSDFKLNMSGSSTIKGIAVNAKNAELNLDKNSSSVLSVSADNLKINAGGKAKATISQDCVDLTANLATNSDIEVNGNSVDVKIDANNYAKAKFVGNANTLVVKGAGSSEINALNLRTATCECVLSNHAIVYEEANESLKLDLTGSSKVVFDNSPAFDIVKIVGSTVIRYEAKDSK